MNLHERWIESVQGAGGGLLWQAIMAFVWSLLLLAGLCLLWLGIAASIWAVLALAGL